MPETTTITVRISTRTRERLDRVAKFTDRSRSYLASEAIEAYVENELGIIEGMLEGTADFEAGRYFTTAEVIAHTDKIIARAAAKRNRSKDKPASSKPLRRKAA